MMFLVCLDRLEWGESILTPPIVFVIGKYALYFPQKIKKHLFHEHEDVKSHT